MARRTLRRVLLVGLATLLALEAIYLVAANIYLNTSRLSALMNRRPQKFVVRWTSAWTIWPGTVHLRKVELRGRSKRIDWYASLDSVSASVGLRPVHDRVVHLRKVSVSGVDYRQRTRMGPGEEAQASAPDLPSVAGFDPSGAAGPPPMAGGKGKEGRQPWTIVADRIRGDAGLIWIDRYRLAGRMKFDTSMRLVVRGELDLSRVRFAMTKGDLFEGERAMLGDLRIDIDTAVRAFVPKGMKAIEVFRLLTGRFQIRSEKASLFFLEPYFKSTPWLKFNGHSKVTADLQLGEGRLQPGSVLVSSSDEIDTDLLDQKLTGSGTISGRIEEAGEGRRAVLDVRLDSFQIGEPGSAKPYASGSGFVVEATSTALDLIEPFTNLQVTADLPQATIPSLASYNRYFPPSVNMSIESGTGQISFHVEGSQREGSVHGWLNLSAKEVLLKFENYEVKGDFRINAQLKDIRVREGRYDVSGTTVELVSRKFPWKANVSLHRADMRFTEPMQIGADVGITMTDTTPLVALFDAQKDISKFVERMMTIPDVKGSASINMGNQGIEANDIEVTGERLHVLADLKLGKSGKNGIMYIKFGVLSVGVEFVNGKKDLDIVRARRWFEKARAQRRSNAVAE
jgi:hypothetical protein